MFTALVRHTACVRGARVVLRRDERNATWGTVVCAVTVALVPSGSARPRSRGPHAYEAINRAVERLGDLMGRRAVKHLSCGHAGVFLAEWPEAPPLRPSGGAGPCSVRRCAINSA